jgi:hypothetical protein
MKSIRLGLVACAALAGVMPVACLAAKGAKADTITLFATEQGWINESGQDNGTFSFNNYIVGNCKAGTCGQPVGEFRNFFAFNVPVLSGPLVGAHLVLDTVDLRLVQSASLTYQVTSLSSPPTFANLGTGTFYGSRIYANLPVIQSGDAPDFVEVGEAGIAMHDAMRRQRRVQLVG